MEEEQTRYERVHPQMGTRFTLALMAPSEKAAREAFDAATKVLDSLNATLSDYVPESELNALAATGSTKPTATPVSPALWEVLAASQRLAHQTHGAFDITVGPFTRAWRQSRKQGRLPTATKLAELHARCGYQHLQLDPKNHTATLTAPKMRLDLGGIAKGYAVDQALKAITDTGITAAMVNGGGDLRGTGQPWRVGLRDLDANALNTLTLNDMACATSGDLFKSITLDGRTFSHLIDPRTGLGLEYRRTVTVLAPDCMTADALASALSVLPTAAGARLMADHYPQASAKVLQLNGDQLQETIMGPYLQHLSGQSSDQSDE